MAAIAQKRRRVEDEVKPKKRRIVKKQKNYHSSSEEEDEDAPKQQRASDAPAGWPKHVVTAKGTDANAVVDLMVNGTHIKFSGPGYHDQVRITRAVFSTPTDINCHRKPRTGARSRSTPPPNRGTGATAASGHTRSSGLTLSLRKERSL